VLLRGLVDPSWPLPNPLWRCPGLPKCGFPSSDHSRLPTATWISFAPSYRVACFAARDSPRRYQGRFPCFAGSQERALLAILRALKRVPLVVCLVFHRWSGHGEVELELLVFRGLSSESAADCFALSPQERITPIALR
jgi:hypothetical protein